MALFDMDREHFRVQKYIINLNDTKPLRFLKYFNLLSFEICQHKSKFSKTYQFYKKGKCKLSQCVLYKNYVDNENIVIRN